MSSLQPDGTSLRKAIRFVSEGLQASQPERLSDLVQRAALKFDLDPNQAEYLHRFYRESTARVEDPSAEGQGSGFSPSD
jgi:hypothetical protein